MSSLLHGGDFTAASGYVGHPFAGLEWIQAGKPEVNDPSLRAGVLGPLQTRSKAVAEDGGHAMSWSSWVLSFLGP